MTDHTKVFRIYQDLMDNHGSGTDDDVLEDRREYDKEMIRTGYDLNKYDGEMLYNLIQGNFRPNWDKYTAKEVYDMIGEAEHEGFDGWSESDRVVIMAFLADIGLALQMSK